MTIILNFANGTSTTTNVSSSFNMEMVNECFLNKDFKGMGVVVSTIKSSVQVY